MPENPRGGRGSKREPTRVFDRNGIKWARFQVAGKEFLARNLNATKHELLLNSNKNTRLVRSEEIFDDWSRVRTEWILIREGRAKMFRFHFTIYSGQELKDRLASAGFINVKLNQNYLASLLQQAGSDPNLSVEKTTTPQTVVVDYSGPNIAKELHVGHLQRDVVHSIDRHRSTLPTVTSPAAIRPSSQTRAIAPQVSGRSLSSHPKASWPSTHARTCVPA